MAQTTFDHSQAPVIVIHLHGEMTDDEFRDYLAETLRIMLASDKIVLMVDAREAAGASRAQRRMQADWMKANETVTKAHVVAMVFVVNSAFIRGILTAILWLQPLPIPHQVFKKMPDAMSWAHSALRIAA
jgi:SpoIIAA-like